MMQIATAMGITKLERAIEVATAYTNKPIVTTLNAEIRDARGCGNTTRQVNFAVDSLFKNYCVICLDHSHYGEDTRANQGLFERVLRRLKNEHPGLVNSEYLGYNQLYSFIYLKT